MVIDICQIPVGDLIEGLCQQVGRAELEGWADWTGSMGFGWTRPIDPRTKTCWATWSNQNDPFARVVLQHLHHFARWQLVGRHTHPDPLTVG